MDKVLQSQKELYEAQTQPDTVEHSYEALVVQRDWIEEELGGAILDVGCAHGSFLKSLRPSWKKVGIDLYGKGDTEVEIIHHDVGQPLPLSDNSFDVICASFIIEHLLDTDLLIKECFRILKPGGALVISTMNMGSPRVYGRLMLGLQPDVMSYSLYDGCRHTRYYTFGAFKTQLEQHGFAVEKRHGAIFMRRFLKLFLPLRYRIKLFGWFPQIGGEIVLKARKPRN